jgi:hypothetical protein
MNRDKRFPFFNFRYSVNRGTTLIELLIYIGLLSIFIGVLTSLFSTAIDIQLGTQSTSALAIDSSYILSRLKYDIQRAQAITTPASLGVNSSILVLSINGVDYTYTKDSNGNLTCTNNLGTINLNSYLASVSTVTFTRIGNAGGAEPTVKIIMTITSRVVQPKGFETQNISTTVALHRN